MIEGFPIETAPLTDYEKGLVNPMVKGFSTKIGEKNAITNREIQEKMKVAGFKVNPARIRKLINHIRMHGLVKNLVATSKGYYIEVSPAKIKQYKKSLEERAGAILALSKTFVYETKVEQTRIFN